MRTLRYIVATLYAVLAYVVPLDRPEASPPPPQISAPKPAQLTWPSPKRSPLERFAR